MSLGGHVERRHRQAVDGEADLMIAGGTETMSMVPMMGHRVTMNPAIFQDENIAIAYGMGITAENIADKYGISREEQDAFAAGSQQKTEAAQNEGVFDGEIVHVEVPQRRGDPVIFDRDEFPRAGTTAEGLGKLRPAFKRDGSVTAGNASGINDGAAAVVLVSKAKMEELGLKPIAKVLGYADASQEPDWFTTTPAKAIPKALDKAGVSADDVDFYEINEAFAVVALAFLRELELDPAIVNVHGGAVAIGHPIGASGARIVVTLLNALQTHEKRYGCAAICLGGGEATALLVENLV